MPEDNQQLTPNQFARPSARPPVAAAPMQRANYGIPPRQSAPIQPQTAGPRMMDVTAPAPRPVQPMQQAQPVAAPQPPAYQPMAQPAPVVPTTAPVQRPEPMFSPTQSAHTAQKAVKKHRIISKFRYVFLFVGALLTIGGIVRYATAGNISGYTIAVGAVTANDGKKTSIQFTADDGKLHRFTVQESKRNEIPGTAMEVAYQTGAADATVKRVSVVKSAHSLGVQMLAAGILFLAIGGIWSFVHYRKNRPAQVQQSQAVPVTA